MSMSFNNLWKSLIGYFSQWPNVEYAIFFIIGVIGISYIFRVLYFYIYTKKNKKNIYYSYQLSGFFSNLTTLFLIIAFSVVFTKFYSFIYINKLQSVIILVLIIYLLLLTRNYFVFLSHNIKFQLSDFGVYSGPIAKSQAQRTNKTRFKNHRIAVLVLLIPFLLLLVHNKDKVLYSIVFDNSSSMEQKNSDACNAINSIVSNLPEGVDFAITIIKPCNTESDEELFLSEVKKNVSDIIAVRNPGELLASTEFFHNLMDIQDYIQNGFSTNSYGGSPIFECIWDNFIVSYNLNTGENYDRKNLIVLTDGEDILYNPDIEATAPNQCIMSFPFKDNTAISDFYNNITFINYANQEDYLFNNLCGDYKIVQGTEPVAIRNAIISEFSDIYFDWNFILLSLIFIAIFSIIIILKV